jgi:rfaE bifunctional protein nucleotidyltransferase chain/domain
MDTREKILSRGGLHEVLEEHRRAGRRIAFASGSFDLLHAADVRYLRAGRDEGDLLVVAVHSDASTRELQGAGRPILTERARATLVAALAAVDYVIVVDEADVKPLLREFQPEVYVHRSDSRSGEAVHDDLSAVLGIRVAIIRNDGERSSSDLVARLLRVKND